MTITNAPIIIPKFDDIKRYCQGCILKYNYILGNPTVTIKSKYLEIKLNTDTTEEIESNLINGKGILNEARLYCPPQNDYQNFSSQIKAELILIHSNGDKTLSLCIPVRTGTGSAPRSQIQFDSIIKSTKLGSVDEEIKASTFNFSVNDFIPRSKYIVLTNTTATWDNSSSNNNIIIFKDPIFISSESLAMLKNKIPSPDGTATQHFDINSGKITKYDKIINGPGMNQKASMTCYPVDMKTGKRIKPGYQSLATGDVVKIPEVSSQFSGAGILYGILALLGVALIVYGCLFLYKRAKMKSAEGAAMKASEAAQAMGAMLNKN